MQQNVQLGDKNYIVGLNWQIVPGGGVARKKDLKEIKTKTGMNLAVSLSGKKRLSETDLDSIGLLTKKSKVPAAAALLAIAQQKVLNEEGEKKWSNKENWILIEKIQASNEQEALYWIGGVQKGLPMSMGDVVEGMHKAQAVIVDMMEALEKEQVTFFTLDPDFLEFLEVDGYDVVHVGMQNVSEIVTDYQKQIKIIFLTGMSDEIKMMMGVITLSIFGVMGWNYYQDLQLQEEIRVKAKLKKKKLEKEQKEAELAKQREIEAQYKKVLRAAEEDLERSLKINAKDLLFGWLDSMEKVPLNHSGWNVSKIFCNQDCQVVLSRDENRGLNRSLMEAIEHAEIKGPIGSYKVSIKHDTHDAIRKDSLLDERTFTKDFISEMQILKIKGIVGDVTIKEPKAMVVNPGGSESQAKVFKTYSQVDFLIKGKDLGTLWILKDELTKNGVFNTMIFNDLEISMPRAGGLDGTTWQINGKVFLKPIENK